jgi:hypothetical protein
MSAYDGSDLNAPLVVFLVILGAGAAIVIGCAVHRLYFTSKADSENNFPSPSKEQGDYMRQLRVRNQMQAWSEAQETRSAPSRGT